MRGPMGTCNKETTPLKVFREEKLLLMNNLFSSLKLARTAFVSIQTFAGNSTRTKQNKKLFEWTNFHFTA